MRSLVILVFICMLLPKATCATPSNSSDSVRSTLTDIQQFFGNVFAGQLTCYTCNPPFCTASDKQTCPSDLKYCLTASASILNQKPIMKACASQAMCDVTQSALLGGIIGNVKCCQTYLCNGAESFTLNFLPMFIPLLSSIFFY